MSDGTAIEWADATWNPLLGCTKVSAGCDFCYAITTARIRESNPNIKVASAYAGIVHRDAAGKLDWTGQVNLLPDRLDQPLRWRKPRRIFVNSQSDLFHDQVPDEFIAKVFAVMAMAPRHTFQILTKRHGRMRSLLNSDHFWRLVGDHGQGIALERVAGRYPSTGPMSLTPDSSAHGYWECARPLPNVWLGVSVENQQWADIRIPALLMTPAAVRFLSMEPLLGPVDLTRIAWSAGGGTHLDVVNGRHGVPDTWQAPGKHVDWVIVGGESGHGARPMHPDWARALRDQCEAAGVPYLFKQWGDGSLWIDKQGDVWTPGVGELMHTPETAPFSREHVERKWGPLKALGKHAAGRQLDGREWNQYPETVTV